MKCPNCSAENQTGSFCSECGASLDTACPECGASVAPGSRFCTTCGEPLSADAGSAPRDTRGSAGRAAPEGGGSRTPWVIAGAAVVVVALVLFFPRDTDPVRPAGSGPPFGSMGGGAAGGAPGMGGLSADMRTNADRLFNRIMMAAEQGNQAEVDQFMPMAIQAYEMVEDLNADGQYHLAILQTTAGDFDGARQTAQRIMDGAPNHLLALGVSATAAAEAGDSAAARTLWGRYLDAWAEESGKPLPEYMDHQPMLEEYRSTAREATGR